MRLAVIETAYIRDSDSVRIALDDFDGRAGGDLAFFGHRKIVAAEMAGDEALDHVVAIKANGQFVAWDARLLDDEQCGTYAYAVPDVQSIFRQAFRREVLAEYTPG